MPRILVKGGIWKNTEDEILKVAVMKYGKNQWSRIASLLHKKTAKQCKTRWYEWLDPHIKKTEWSRDEDEKLLHLAKLMPTQWRTIAPIVGRTAAQCLERYEYLLDKVQEAADDVETADVVSDPRKLKPGEIDPNPESKPAKPDAIDMDEDELEMLSEARARLANTQGKKAKRKARERQLDEARRLSSMQKRRELLAAGIQGFRTLGRRKLRTFIDYTKEVPFERKAPQGFFDADEDQFNKKDPDFVAFQKNLQKELNDKNEHLLRKKDKDKQKRKLESDPELALLQMHGGGNAANVDIFTKRAKLTLPEPQVNDDELGQVVKIGMETQYARDSITGANNNTFDTGDLLADYSTTPATSSRDLSQLGSSKLRTPSTISRETNILNEARNIIALNNVQTPLVGGENTELDVGKMDFAGVTPKVAPIQTPNTVLRQTVTTQTNQTIGATPSVLMGESVRDKMGINSMRGSVNQRQEDSIDEDRTNHDLNADITTPSTMMSNYNGSMKLEKKLQRMQLRTMLDMLPKPEDDFEIVIPEKNEKLMSSNDYDDVDMEIQKDGMLFSSENKNAPSVLTVIDAADLDAEKQQLLEIERKKRLSMLSTVVQKGFPHPLNLPANSKSNESEMSTVEQLIQQEMGNMVKNVLTDYLDLIVDSSLKPLTLTQKKFRTKIVNDLGFKSNKVPSSSDVSYDDIEKAKELVKDEYEEFLKDCLFDHDFPQFSEYIDEINNSIMLSNSATKDSQLDVTNLKQELDYLKSIMHKYSQKVAKNQTKLEILVGGYQRNINNYSSKYAKLLNEYSSLHENREMFGRLLSTENKILENRLTEWKNKLLQQKQLQHFLQQRYLELTSMANNLNN